MIEALFMALIFLILIWLAAYIVARIVAGVGVVPPWISTVIYAIAAIASLIVLFRLFQRVGGGLGL